MRRFDLAPSANSRILSINRSSHQHFNLRSILSARLIYSLSSCCRVGASPITTSIAIHYLLLVGFIQSRLVRRIFCCVSSDRPLRSKAYSLSDHDGLFLFIWVVIRHRLGVLFLVNVSIILVLMLKEHLFHIKAWKKTSIFILESRDSTSRNVVLYPVAIIWCSSMRIHTSRVPITWRSILKSGCFVSALSARHFKDCFTRMLYFPDIVENIHSSDTNFHGKSLCLILQSTLRRLDLRLCFGSLMEFLF